MAKKTNTKKANKDIADHKKMLDDDKINIMLLGTSGAGKSTLINAFLDTKMEHAPTGIGTAVTDRIDVYGDLSRLPFRLIDTPGLEYSHKKQNWLTKEIKKWLKDSVKNPDPKTIIHTIWFCVEGSHKRLSESTLEYLKTISKFWEGVPIVFVSTKTFFEEDAAENKKMIEDILEEYGKDNFNVKAVIPVLAEKKDQIEPMGLEELRAVTEQLAPEAKSIFVRNWKEKLSGKKRLEANKVVVSRTLAAIGADIAKTGGVSKVVSPIQMEMFTHIADIYEINDDNTIKNIATKIMGANAIATVGKKLAEYAEKFAKGKWKLAAKAAKATVSGVVTLTLGEIAIGVFEGMYKGSIDVENTDWDKYVETAIQDKGFIDRLKKLKDAIKDKDGDTFVDELIELIGKVGVSK